MSAYQYNVDEQVAAVKARLGQHKSAILSSSSAQVPTRCGDGAPVLGGQTLLRTHIYLAKNCGQPVQQDG